MAIYRYTQIVYRYISTWTWLYNYSVLYVLVLLKALPPVCMKYTAQGESCTIFVIKGCIFYKNEAAVLYCAIFATCLSPRAVYFIQTGSSALSNSYRPKTSYYLANNKLLVFICQASRLNGLDALTICL